MNLAAIPTLPLVPQTGNWYRAVDPQFLPAAISTAHTPRIPSRFSPGPLGRPPFEILYLAENHLVALYEAQALFGSPHRPGGTVPNPSGTWVVISTYVQLSAVLDLTQPSAQSTLDTTAQELTGDWQGYGIRSSSTSVPAPVGRAPTQDLGEAVQQDPRKIEGMLAVSARVPYHKALIVFPRNLRTGNYVKFTYTDPSGVPRDVVISGF